MSANGISNHLSETEKGITAYTPLFPCNDLMVSLSDFLG